MPLPGASRTALTCDPARIAFREIMNRIPHLRAAYSKEEVGTPPPPPPSPRVPTDVGRDRRGPRGLPLKHSTAPGPDLLSTQEQQENNKMISC
jgi:hypothetical protein